MKYSGYQTSKSQLSTFETLRFLRVLVFLFVTAYMEKDVEILSSATDPITVTALVSFFTRQQYTSYPQEKNSSFLLER